MSRTLKRLDLLVKEVEDPYAQENFWRIRSLISDLTANGIPGPAGPSGPMGPAGPPGPAASVVQQIIVTFNCPATVAVGHLVRLTGLNTVDTIADNATATIPNGMFGIAYAKPTSTTVDVVFAGKTTSAYVGLTIGAAVFISTGGVPTHTPPATGMVQQIGFASSTTEIFVHLLQAMRRS